ncbi:MAG: hypothetical protein ACNA7H_01050 [Desulfotignum sp.]
METILQTRINNIDAVAATRTQIALSTFKESAKILLDKIPS